MSEDVTLLFLFFLLCCLLHQRVDCAVVSQSSIAMCEAGDSKEPTAEGGKTCEKKMLVSMTLKGGQVDIR